LVDMLQPVIWGPLLMGALYLGARILFTQSIWYLKGRLEGHRSPWAARLRYGIEWSFAGQVVGVIASVGYLFVMLLNGTFAATDVGLGPVQVQDIPAWIYGIVPGAALWVALLWGGLWRRKQRLGRKDALPRHETFDPLRVIEREATLSILRGAIMPLAGVYWGAWLPVLMSWLAGRGSPFQRMRRSNPGERDLAYLHGALDWVSAALWVMSGSMWVAFSGRALGYIVAWLAWRINLIDRPVLSGVRRSPSVAVRKG
jgi:hypothetical protein